MGSTVSRVPASARISSAAVEKIVKNQFFTCKPAKVLFLFLTCSLSV